jgi:hypothetical protein
MLGFHEVFRRALGLQRMPPGRSVRIATKSIWIVVAIGLFGLGGCISRTLPLPPPEVRSVTAPDSDGLVTVRGYALEGAAVGVMNDRTQEGVITATSDEKCESTCPWEAQLHAEIGDSLRVWQFFETGGAKDVTVPDK